MQGRAAKMGSHIEKTQKPRTRILNKQIGGQLLIDVGASYGLSRMGMATAG